MIVSLLPPAIPRGLDFVFAFGLALVWSDSDF